MSVNLSYGISVKKTKHLGSYFSTIDFEVEHCSKTYLETMGEHRINAGKLCIGGREQKVSLSELNNIINTSDLSNLQLPEQLTKAERERIVETCYNAKIIFFQKLRLNV